jgi:hypothetical protein
MHTQALAQVDLVLAAFFALNWAFWFYVADDRVRYCFSFWSFVDLITIVPSFVLYALGATTNDTIQGLNFLRVLRCVRVLTARLGARRALARCPPRARAYVCVQRVANACAARSRQGGVSETAERGSSSSWPPTHPLVRCAGSCVCCACCA